MKEPTRNLKILIALTILLFASLACSMGGVEINGDTLRITVNMNEDQVNDLLQNSTNKNENADAILKNVSRVDMQEGIVRVYGEHERDNGSTVEGSYDLALSTENGKLRAEVTGVDIEGVSLNDKRIEKLNRQLEESFTESAKQDNGETTFESVKITNDSLSLVVSVKTNNK